MMKNARSIGTPAKKTKAARARKSSPAKARSSKRQARKVKPPTAPASVAAKGVDAIAPVAADATADPKKAKKSKQQSYEIPPELRDFAEKSVEQARKAIDGFMGAARKTADTLESSATTVQDKAKDVSRKIYSYAEQNLAAAFDLAQRLVRAKDVQEAMQIQAEYVRSQFAAMQAQMKEFGSAAQSAMGPTTGAGGSKK
jgi:phasin